MALSINQSIIINTLQSIIFLRKSIRFQPLLILIALFFVIMSISFKDLLID